MSDDRPKKGKLHGSTRFHQGTRTTCIGIVRLPTCSISITSSSSYYQNGHSKDHSARCGEQPNVSERMRTDSLWSNGCSNTSSDPLLQPTSLGNPKHTTTRVRQSLLLSSDIGREPLEQNSNRRIPRNAIAWTIPAACRGHRFLTVNPLMSRSFLIFCLVKRAVNVPYTKKYLFLKRNVFVTLSNPETTAKTAEVPVKRQMANWNQNMDELYIFPLSFQFCA